MKVIRSSLCACCTPAVLRFSRIIWGKDCLAPYPALSSFSGVDQFIVFIHAQHAVGAEALDGEGTGHADLLLVLVRLVVKIFKLGLGGDGLVDFLLPGDAGLSTNQ